MIFLGCSAVADSFRRFRIQCTFILSFPVQFLPCVRHAVIDVACSRNALGNIRCVSCDLGCDDTLFRVLNVRQRKVLRRRDIAQEGGAGGGRDGPADGGGGTRLDDKLAADIPALGAQGVNIMQFCQAFNAQTQDQAGTIIPVEITVYEDKSFTFVCKTPPAAVLIKEKLGIKSGAAIPQIQVAGTLTEDQLREIAEIKMPDLNANDIEAAMEIVAGTARSMGVRIEGREMKKKYVPSRKVAAMLQGKAVD